MNWSFCRMAGDSISRPASSSCTMKYYMMRALSSRSFTQE